MRDEFGARHRRRRRNDIEAERNGQRFVRIGNRLAWMAGIRIRIQEAMRQAGLDLVEVLRAVVEQPLRSPVRTRCIDLRAEKLEILLDERF